MSKTIITKEQLMETVIRGQQRECFEHSTEGLFDVTAMRRGLATGQIPAESVNIALECITPFVRENRVTDPARVDNLREESWKSDPAIFIRLVEDDGEVSHLMIDGHHRALRREQEGLDFIQCWVVERQHALRPPAQWVKNHFVDWGDEIIDGKIVKR